MRLTKQTNYGIRIAMYCAANPEPLSQVRDIAKSYGVSELFLFKITKVLVDAGIIRTVRGRNGGLQLARPAEDISLFEIVRATEDSFSMAECFDDRGDAECPLVDACGLNATLRKALNAFFGELMAVSVADLIENRAFVRGRLGLAQTASLA
ncbi:MAG: iron-responsive transcriptional regulator RirA [Hyphomicrobiales bacterium]|nr:iron-responsive transcriptional regulator RirA [Nitratireductor sp.]MCC2096882.1 iron-responsive transcriptional regulator RirA [Hyphomicrobiales bacterium]